MNGNLFAAAQISDLIIRIDMILRHSVFVEAAPGQAGRYLVRDDRRAGRGRALPTPLRRPWGASPAALGRSTQGVENEPAPGVESRQQLAVVAFQLLYDRLVVEIPGVPVQEAAPRRASPFEMRENGGIYERVLRCETMGTLVLRRGAQHGGIEWNHFRRLRETRTYFLETLALLDVDVHEQRGHVAKPVKSPRIGRGSSNLTKLRIDLLFQSLALLLSPCEGLVGFSQGIRRNHELHAPRFAQTQDFLATRGLLLKQSKLEHEVRLDVDVHAVASNSMRPSLTAV